jgi:hypothetical protein
MAGARVGAMRTKMPLVFVFDGKPTLRRQDRATRGRTATPQYSEVRERFEAYVCGSCRFRFLILANRIQ